MEASILIRFAGFTKLPFVIGITFQLQNFVPLTTYSQVIKNNVIVGFRS